MLKNASLARGACLFSYRKLSDLGPVPCVESLKITSVRQGIAITDLLGPRGVFRKNGINLKQGVEGYMEYWVWGIEYGVNIMGYWG